MPKKRRVGKQGRQALPASKVTLAPIRDLGATGPANRAGLVIERVADSPNGEKRARRVDMLEVYHARGTVTDRQHAAGKVLREAWLRTHMGPAVDLAQERVDKSPDPSRAITIAIDHLSRFIAVTRRIPTHDAEILYCVVCMERSVVAMSRYRGERRRLGEEHLRSALSQLADALRI